MPRLHALALAAALLAASSAGAQEFKPYPDPRVTAGQWQAYLDEVRSRHGQAAQPLPEQQLVIFHDRENKTSYTFTLPGHPAHPAWVTRRLQHTLEGMAVRHVGFYAGELDAFARLFEQLLKVSEGARQQLQRGPGDPV